jgi:glycosyltransferase involved in cell wall biosynthesis
VTRLPQCTGSLQSGVQLEQLFHHYNYLADVNIFVSYPHAHEDVFGTLPPAYFHHRRNIIHLAWEQQDWNHHWKAIYERYDEIWAISDFAAAPFKAMFGADVKVVPNVLNVEEYPDCSEECAARFAHDPFVFLFVFDANSSIERKNPQAVIDAFIQAFKGTNVAHSVKLILKVSNLFRHEHVPRVEAMMRSAGASGMQIEFDGRQLTRAELLRLVASADCFVSLHRSEGFGYTMAEAMYYAVPVIASGYSGNLQYMDHDNSFLVPCTECPVEVADGPFQRGSVWARPDIDAAADFMRRVVGDRDEARRIGELGRATVLSKLTAAAVAEGLRDSLLARHADRGPPLFGAGSGLWSAVPTDAS